VLIDRLPFVTSYFDAGTNPTARYEVRAIFGQIAGGSSFVNADGSDVCIGSRPIDTPNVSPSTVEPPTNIRLDGNVLRWDEVAGVSKYNIYRLSSARPNPNGTYPAKVVGANEVALSASDIYTVVSTSRDGSTSTLDASGRVDFDF